MKITKAEWITLILVAGGIVALSYFTPLFLVLLVLVAIYFYYKRKSG